MHPEIEKLLIVQEIDGEIRRVREELGRYPDWRRARTTEIERERGRVDEARNRLNDLEKRIRASDLELREAREALRRLLGQQSRVKTQKEYDALTHEIQQTEERIVKADDQGLEALAEQENEQERLKELQRALEAKEREYSEEIARLDAREKEKSDQLKMYTERRAQAAAAVSPATLHRYDRLASVFPGSCVVAVKDGNCAGCFMRVLPRRLQELGRDDAINECDSCHRFLYLPKCAPPDAEA